MNETYRLMCGAASNRHLVVTGKPLMGKTAIASVVENEARRLGIPVAAWQATARPTPVREIHRIQRTLLGVHSVVGARTTRTISESLGALHRTAIARQVSVLVVLDEAQALRPTNALGQLFEAIEGGEPADSTGGVHLLLFGVAPLLGNRLIAELRSWPREDTAVIELRELAPREAIGVVRDLLRPSGKCMPSNVERDLALAGGGRPYRLRLAVREIIAIAGDSPWVTYDHLRVLLRRRRSLRDALGAAATFPLPAEGIELIPTLAPPPVPLQPPTGQLDLTPPWRSRRITRSLSPETLGIGPQERQL